MRRMLDAGVDGVVTDQPWLLLEAIESRMARCGNVPLQHSSGGGGGGGVARQHARSARAGGMLQLADLEKDSL